MFEVENIDVKEEPVSNVVISEYFIAYSVCVLLNYVCYCLLYSVSLCTVLIVLLLLITETYY